MEQKFKNIFWGVILLTLGLVLALKNFGVIHFSWRALLQLWPILLILWGISVLPVKASLKLVLALCVAALSVVLVYHRSPQYENRPFWQWNTDTEWKDEDWTPKEQVLTEPMDSSVKFVKFKLEAGAGKFSVADTTMALIYFHKSGNIGPYALESFDDDKGRTLHINMEGGDVNLGKVENDVHIKLNPQPIWDVEINAGAAEMNLDLTPFKVRSFKLASGAASAELKLGASIDTTQVKIEMGAASIKVMVPKDAGCQVKSESFLTSRKLDGFDKITSDLYQTPGFDKATRKVIIDLKAAASNFKVERY
jgi:hypothetical protein